MTFSSKPLFLGDLPLLRLSTGGYITLDRWRMGDLRIQAIHGFQQSKSGIQRMQNGYCMGLSRNGRQFYGLLIGNMINVKHTRRGTGWGNGVNNLTYRGGFDLLKHYWGGFNAEPSEQFGW